MTRELDTFRRTLRNLESSYRRLDGGQLTGRNASASGATRDRRYAELVELVRTSDAVTDELDRDEQLAARWNRLERRHVGLATPAAPRSTGSRFLAPLLGGDEVGS